MAKTYNEAIQEIADKSEYTVVFTDGTKMKFMGVMPKETNGWVMFNGTQLNIDTIKAIIDENDSHTWVEEAGDRYIG